MVLLFKSFSLSRLNNSILEVSRSCRISPKRKLTTTTTKTTFLKNNCVVVASSSAKRFRPANLAFQLNQSIQQLSSSSTLLNTMSDIADLEEQVKNCRISVKEQVQNFFYHFKKKTNTSKNIMRSYTLLAFWKERQTCA